MLGERELPDLVAGETVKCQVRRAIVGELEFPSCSQIAKKASNWEASQTRLTDSEESRKGMVGATGIEPMTSTVSR